MNIPKGQTNLVFQSPVMGSLGMGTPKSAILNANQYDPLASPMAITRKNSITKATPKDFDIRSKFSIHAQQASLGSIREDNRSSFGQSHAELNNKSKSRLGDEADGSAKLDILKPLLENLKQADHQDRPLRVDIIAHNSVSLYQFIGYLLDVSGQLNRIYDDVCKEITLGNEKRQKEYLDKLKEMQTTNSYNAKLELPVEEPLPPKQYESMFEEYIKLHEMSITDDFNIELFDKRFIFKYRMLDKVSPERIRVLPDAVIFLVDGMDEDFQKQFIDCDEIKQAFFMHLFFGTRNIFFFSYFSYRDRLFRHAEYQVPHYRKVKQSLSQIFSFISMFF